MDFRRYFILPVKVTRKGQIVSIDQSVPAHINGCVGILATVKDFLETGHEIQHVGEFSLMLNSAEVHPIHYSVGYSNLPLKKDNHFLPVEEQINPGTRISGFYHDAGTATDDKGSFLPYTVNIYLDCKAHK